MTSQLTFSQAQGHFPRESRAADQRDPNSAALSGSGIGFALPGSVVVRDDPCGKDNCACHGDPPRLHGPSIQWTRTIDNKTVNRVLGAEQWQDYEAWFANARKLRVLIADLERLSLEIFEEDHRWPKRSSH